MWPVIWSVIRTRAPYITLPFAAVIGFIGYHIEGLLSDRYTPSNKSISETRLDRLTQEDVLDDATNVKKLKYNENVLGRNLSPSLQEQH